MSARDRILEATASAADALLTIEDLDDAVNSALQIIGESVETDRITVMEQFDDLSGRALGCIKVVYEWDSPGTVSQLFNSKLAQVSWEGIE